MQRPTFFLSSTIYDFRDLRGALKFYLEEQGCKVLASEFNDFQKPLDQHSYRACLDAIHAADYFVLLVGSRVGGWFDESNRISITQREYREAYELHRNGKLKILSFVRSDVWVAKEERRGLASYLEGIAIEDSLKNGITNYASKAATDAEFISSFLSEIGKNKETLQSVRNGTPAPTGNWINIFTDFRDVVRVLEGTLFSSTPMEDMTMRRLLRRELRDFLKETLVKFGKISIHSPRQAIDLFHEQTPITREGRNNSYTEVQTKTWDRLSSLSISLLGRQLHPLVLNQAIAAPTFLKFDLNSNSYRETAVYEALLQLQEEIRRLDRANSSEALSIVFEHSPKNFPNRGEILTLDTRALATFLHLMDRWANVIDLSQALVAHLDGQPFVSPTLRPASPIQGLERDLLAERITDEELDLFLNGK